jgi:hypothetical protein
VGEDQAFLHGQPAGLYSMRDVVDSL